MRVAAHMYTHIRRRWMHGTRGAGAEGRGMGRGMGRGGGGGATAEYAGGYQREAARALCDFTLRSSPWLDWQPGTLSYFCLLLIDFAWFTDGVDVGETGSGCCCGLLCFPWQL